MLEYEEAKEILKTNFGGEGRRRQLQVYMDQLEAMPSLKGIVICRALRDSQILSG
jgi:hypothetical protein